MASKARATVSVCFSSLSTRFGTVAVPNILLFQGVKPMARFNHTDRTLDALTFFIANQTGVHHEQIYIFISSQIGWYLSFFCFLTIKKRKSRVGIELMIMLNSLQCCVSNI